MSLNFYDRVQQSSNTTGTGNFVLSGNYDGYRSFESTVGIGNQFYYCIEHTVTKLFEIGVGTLVSGTEFSRDSVIASSNSNSLVNFASGEKRVFLTVPAEALNFDNNYVHVQSSAAATWNITHNLNKMPSVSVVDSGGTLVYGSITYINNNSLTISFSSAFGGKAYLN